MEEMITIEHVRSGQSDEYEVLVKRYHVGLIIHCENIVKNRHEAEDIAQEAFVTAYEKLASYDATKARFSTWLYRIATNKCLDYLRRERRHLDVEDIERIAAVTEPCHIETDERERLRAAVEALTPPEYRQVIELYFWHGKSYSEIADELATNSNTVATWMSRAKQQLKEVMT